MAMTLPPLSVVVIGRNEGQRLVRCLESIAAIRSAHPELEVIYVDSASSDGSRETATRLGAKTIALEASHPTAALGRNAGWKQASAEYVLFLDGDTILHPDFPERAFESLLADPAIAAVWGHRREIHPEASLYNRILDLDWIYPPGPAEFCGGDVLMRRSALEAAGGYDGTLIAGEEPELCRRMRALGYQILHIDAPMTGHDLEMRRFRQYWKRALRAGFAYAQVSSRFRGTGDPFWQSDRIANLRRGGFWALSFLATLVLSAVLRSVLPAAAWIALLLVLSLRSAWKARWKSASAVTLLLYGLHSQLQQVPICIGQLSYDLDPRKGRQKKLIEYKGASSLP
ncbi:glycosyltransferase involved in cell wall biosynthesis [Silvibacterium bohemicum]|uniref:Glycosyltransferase involved in cell wall biosynthesis n=1 Tax=Silvibacterium bohemicum TaxID=1577686 RepID=A0A841JSR7_9BACT|nr:glycosyltransferase [Silvibacterium bohemicum]MBB6142809.1 glycosyltransferase involved in cell wall biosynthesis [Silvibacterium bohemicum]